MHIYAIALGSNRWHRRYRTPRSVVLAAVEALRADVRVVTVSSILATPALGPAGRAFANAAMLIETTLEPPVLLALLKRLERAFGRRHGRRWGPRVLDLDILLWSGGVYRERRLAVPHPALAQRRFVLDPLVTIAPGWRLPNGTTIRQARARLTARRPLHRASGIVGP